MHSDTEVHELNQHIRELEGRMRTLNQDNELLRAQVDESDYWIYERGPIQQELLELRDNSVTQTREINRLTRENASISDDLRRAEKAVSTVHRRHQPHEIGHPPLTAQERARARAVQIPERASITQTFKEISIFSSYLIYFHYFPRHMEDFLAFWKTNGFKLIN